MLTTKVDKKKILEYSAILGIIFAIILYILITNFLIKPETKDSSDTNIKKTTPVKNVKEIEVDIINDPKFKNLQENPVIEKDIEELEVGKKNPFSAEGGKNK